MWDLLSVGLTLCGCSCFCFLLLLLLVLVLVVHVIRRSFDAFETNTSEGTLRTFLKVFKHHHCKLGSLSTRLSKRSLSQTLMRFVFAVLSSACAAPSPTHMSSHSRRAKLVAATLDRCAYPVRYCAHYPDVLRATACCVHLDAGIWMSYRVRSRSATLDCWRNGCELSVKRRF